MLGLRVRGRGGRDRTAAVAAPISAFLWGSTPFLCARAKKWGGIGRASAVYCLIKRRTRKKRKLGIRLFFALCVCAVSLGGFRCPLLPFDPISLVLAQRNGVEPPKKSAFLPRRLHHSRERYKSVVYTFLARLLAGLVRVGGGWVHTRRRAKRPPKSFGGLLLTFGLDHTSSMTAISAASPRRGPVRVTRV